MTLLRLTPAMATHRGMRRRQNEDSVDYEYPTDLNTLQTYGALFVVADGVGGLSAGEQASQMAVEKLIQYYYAGDSGTDADERLALAFQRTNDDVFRSLKREAATTLIAVVVLDNKLIAASIGDSIIYRIRGDSIEQLNEEDVVHSNDKQDGALTKAIGYREDLEVETIIGTLQEGDKFLLCSDGITRYLKPEQLLRLADLRDPRDSVRRMINQANAAGGADNVTVLLVQVGEEISAEELAKHQQKVSVRVAVDTDPMIKLDVPTKPHTQIPLAPPPERIRPQDRANEVTYSQEHIPQVAPPSVPVETKNTGRNTNILILLAVVVIVVGAIIIGGGLALSFLNNPTASPVPAETPATNVEVTETGISTPENSSPKATQLVSPEEAQIGDIIDLSASVLTLERVDNSQIAAFTALPRTNYIINEIFKDSEGQLWYRLLDQESNQAGWVLVSALPDFQLHRD